jgi:DNA polymerase-3 subunit delta
MIYKSHIIEEDINQLGNNITLFYGENFGLINEFKEKIQETNKNKKIIKVNQENILKDQNIIFSEIRNISLFDEKKIIFIYGANDKILNIIEEIKPSIDKNEIFIFGNILDKKSKLRSQFEKSKEYNIVACYKDNEVNLRKLITNKLKGYSGVSSEVISALLENSGLDRMKLNNEIEKIKILFIDKKISFNLLEKILNLKTEEHFDVIKDFALKGNNKMTNTLLNETVLEKERIPFYLNIINQRLNRLKEIKIASEGKNISNFMNTLRPPVFWKDKPNFIKQEKLWDNKKLSLALNQTYNLELSIKSNSDVNKTILIKKLLLDLCVLANS